MRKILNTRKKVIIASAAAGAIVLGTGGAAYAYFAASASGTGSATVGTAGSWSVSAAPATGGPIVPGSGTERIAFTVTNAGSSPLKLTSVTPSVNADGNGFITVSNNPVGSCYATWFNATVANPADEPGLNTEIAANATTTVTVTVTMPADDVHDQTACASTSPDINLKVS